MVQFPKPSPKLVSRGAIIVRKLIIRFDILKNLPFLFEGQSLQQSVIQIPFKTQKTTEPIPLTPFTIISQMNRKVEGGGVAPDQLSPCQTNEKMAGTSITMRYVEAQITKSRDEFVEVLQRKRGQKMYVITETIEFAVKYDYPIPTITLLKEVQLVTTSKQKTERTTTFLQIALDPFCSCSCFWNQIQESINQKYYYKFNLLLQTRMTRKSFRYALIVFLFSVLSGFAKRTSKTIYLEEFIEHESHTKFLTKFDFGVGISNTTIRYRQIAKQHRKLSKDPTIPFSLKIGLLTDDNFEKFKLTTACSQKEKLYNQTYKLTFYDSHQGTQFMRISETQRERIWFIYVFTCDKVDNMNVLPDAALLFQVAMLNVDSNLGEDEKIVGPYIGLMLLWLILLFKIMIPIVKSLLRKPTTAESMLYCGYLILGLALFYRMIEIISKQYSGQDIMVFVYLHFIFKFVIEGFMVALLVSIAWGWSLIHTTFDAKYIALSLAMVATNITCFVVWHNSEEIDESYLIYEHKTGIIILIVRFLVFLIFIIGCLRSTVAFVGKRKYFIQYYAKLGSVYLLTWPITVVFTKILFPRYMVNQIVTITEEAVHMLMNAYICWLFAYPDSSYKKISLKDEDFQASMGIMPTYKH